MQPLSAMWSSDPRLRKGDRATRRHGEPGCPIKGGGRPSSPEMQWFRSASSLCGYSNLEEEGWTDTVTTQNAQSRQLQGLSQ